MTEQYPQRDINDGDPNLGSLRENFSFFDEFMGIYSLIAPGTTNGIGEQNWNGSVVDSGRIRSVPGIPESSVGIVDHIGQAEIVLGAGAPSVVAINQAQVPLAGIRFQAEINLVDIGTPTVEEFAYIVSIAGGVGGGTFTDGFGFIYDCRSSANWLVVTDNSGGGEITTTIDTGVLVVADTWFTLGARYYVDLSQCNFFINGSLVATSTTNLPTNPPLFGNAFPIITIDRAGGAAVAARRTLVDYFYMQRTIAR